jgi:4'-phosphopantetheinyl transferase
VQSNAILLPSGCVHVWVASAGPPGSIARSALALLDAEERERAEKFRFNDHRNAYIAAHAALRRILAGYLDCNPSEIRFGRSADGKPLLAGERHDLELCFNLSRTTALAVIAVSLDPVGVDVEHIRPIAEMEAIAQSHFSAQELASLRSEPDGRKLQAFFSCWTRKEACVKAVGKGLTVPLKMFDTSTPDRTGAPVQIPGDPSASGWRVSNIEVPPGYAGALAATSGCREVAYKQL